MPTDVDSIYAGAKLVFNPQLTQRIAYNAQGMQQYIGEAQPGSDTSAAVWRVRELIYSGTQLTQVIWADGDTKFDNIWDNRGTLTYS